MAVGSDVFSGFNKGGFWPTNRVFDEIVFGKNGHLQASRGSETPIFESATEFGAFWTDYRPNLRLLDPFPGHFSILPIYLFLFHRR